MLSERKKIGKGRSRRRNIAAVEKLEKRLCLTAITWTAASGNWNVAGNWSVNRIPGVGDDVTIPAGANVSISDTEAAASVNSAAGATLAISGGTLSLGADASVVAGSFNVNGSLNIGAGSVTLGGVTNWSGGAINLAGNTVINAPAGVINLTSDLTLDAAGADFGTLDNKGQISESAGSITLDEAATLDNEGTFQFSGDANIDSVAVFGNRGGSVINTSTGTIIKTAAGGTSAIAAAVNNSGTIQVSSGTLALSNTLTQASNSTLTAGTYAAINSATLSFPSGTFIASNDANLLLSGIGANITGITNLAANSGDVTIENGAGFTSAGGFSNNGQLILGLTSTLNVEGAFTQGGSGTLAIELGGPPGGSQFGAISSTGPATLGGTVQTLLLNSYSPSPNDAFTVASFSSASGAFAAVSTVPSNTLLFEPAVNADQSSLMLTAMQRQTALSAAVRSPAGFGTQGFVPANTALSYTINFANGASATEAAQTATITDQLDANLDFTTFQFGTIGFDGNTITVPAGSQSFSTQFNATAQLGVLVNVNASFNATTGVATWTFSSIDPNTMTAPTNTLIGFLPSAATAAVTYSAKPQSSITTGSLIAVQASAAFNASSPIMTAQVSNTIDAIAPTTTIAPLPDTEISTAFNLNLIGQDDANGSGLASDSIFVSDNGGTFAPLLINTTETSIPFTGQAGHTYGFYSIGTDNAGNVESTPANAEAVTFITGAATVTNQVLRVQGSTGNDTIKVSESDGEISVKMNGRPQSFEANTVSTIQIVGGAGADSLKAGMTAPLVYINGGGGNDTIIAKNSTANTLLGGNGSDSISAGGGNESLDGGNGNDTLIGGSGVDLLSGDAGNDSLTAGPGADLLLGGPGADTLFAVIATNTLKGNGGADSLLGNGTGAELIGGAGDNSIVP